MSCINSATSSTDAWASSCWNRSICCCSTGRAHSPSQNASLLDFDICTLRRQTRPAGKRDQVMRDKHECTEGEVGESSSSSSSCRTKQQQQKKKYRSALGKLDRVGSWHIRRTQDSLGQLAQETNKRHNFKHTQHKRDKNRV